MHKEPWFRSFHPQWQTNAAAFELLFRPRRWVREAVRCEMRAGGLLQMQKIAHLAEAHHVMVAPHSGSLGPVAEMAAVQLMCTLPNFLILEHLDDDVPQRYEVMKNTPVVTDGYITVPELPGLGVDIDEAECAKHPSLGNINEPDA